ncbi:MutH/Sau3AI family endonuclease [Fibrobacter sp. UWP2]|jgi:hypothetical protein|uniref:MutH/Sau3AI family endonuclease n=1 Tax=Fibrobacter sp. UWP2 TaxID=1896216 RepID=UPI000911A932|nr:MutH/Sau3AI family endonuclease [Fibrobacter sp. UWP2]SHJ51920.1 DNA mismatch repair enzyme MutH [Fibrobacter sp. UWP2]
MAIEIEHKFTKRDVEILLDCCLNRTLGEIDRNHVFDKTIKSPKITGIAGDVIEQSVFGYKANSSKEPDLIVDGVKTELKTTGIRFSKKEKNKYEAKEPVSITAVSPNTIIDEEFNTSHFWQKLEHLLFVYYLYSSAKKTVPAAEYAAFLVKGYQFVEFSDDDKEILKQDWLIVRNFIQSLNKNPSFYPEISHLRSKLLFIDTAPKWPHPPRFRLKRSLVTSIVQSHFKESLEQLPQKYDTYSEIDSKCGEITRLYKGWTVSKLVKEFEINGKIDKGIGERLVVRMFGGSAKKMQKIDLFNKIGLIGKTIVLTEKGKRTEDMKLFRIDFDEIIPDNNNFSESEIYDFFIGNQVLCIMFEEHDKNDFGKNTFIGFKRLSFSDELIDFCVKPVWERIWHLVINKELKDIPILDKHGNVRINKTGVPQTAPNFPKSSESVVFVRGDSSDSTKKTEIVNGIRMYRQYIWIKGSYVSEMLKEKDFI